MTTGLAGEEALLAARAEVPTCERFVHLVSHSNGPAPRGVREVAQAYADDWEREAVGVWQKWMPAVHELGDLIARVLGAAPKSVVALPNCSTAHVIVASSFDYRAGPRRKVVYDDLVFPSMHYIWKAQERNGAEIHVVRSDGVKPPIDALLEAIDEQTLIVPISHVMFRAGAMIDIERVMARAREVGAFVFLDVYQSAGVVPIDLGRWGCELACGGSLKWTCGGPGGGYLYVRPDVLDRLSPTAIGWFGHAQPFAFDMDEMRFADGSARFLGGVPTIPSILTAHVGWALIERLGVDRIRSKSLRQTRKVREMLAEQGGIRFTTPAEDDERGGFLAFDFDGAAEASQELARRRFLQDHRPGGGMRISPHFFTTDAELEAFVRELASVRTGLRRA